MNAFNPYNYLNPYNYVSLNGQGTMRGVTVEVPTEQAQRLLPHGLELGVQDITRPGYHPLILFFHDMFKAHMSIPSPLPSLTYHEHSLGVPFCYVRSGATSTGGSGPFYFMPTLHLDSFLATLGGVLYWGFAKQMASFTVVQDRYTVVSSRGNTVTSLQFRPCGEYQPLSAYPAFEPIRQVLNQPIVSLLPLAMGPFFICSNFDKEWSAATIRPLETVMNIDEAYAPGLEPGAYPREGFSPGIDKSVLGSYELLSPWRLSMPYPPYAAGMV